MKNKITTAVALLIIIAGIGVAAFPLIDYWRMEYYRGEMLSSYNDRFALDVTNDENVNSFIEEMTEPSSYVSETTVPGDVPREEDVLEFTTNPKETETTTEAVDKATDLTVIGTIQIPKIDVDIPIFKYSTQYQMDFGAVHVEGTTPIGTVGNCGIAAHRGRAKWYFFNRLDELVPGDTIIINHGGVIYTYTVYESLLVYPHQTEVLNRSRTQKVLTLITCHPPGADTYRLIIHALQN